VTVPRKQYFAIGYGWNMQNTDMCWWSSSGTSSIQQDLWSKANDGPDVDDVNTYQTTYQYNSDGSCTFTSVRLLDPGTSSRNSYVIEPNKDLQLCFAFNPRSSEMSDHHDHRGVFTLHLNSHTG